MVNDVSEPPRVASDHRSPAGERFDGDKTEWLWCIRRNDNDVTLSDETPNVNHFPHNLDGVRIHRVGNQLAHVHGFASQRRTTGDN